MRDYLYIWNDPVNQCIVASGIQFRDISEWIGLGGGVVLLNHGAKFVDEWIEHDRESGFYYVTTECIPGLAQEDTYSWGDFAWADYAGDGLPNIPDPEMAELLFFGHTGRPLCQVAIPSINNKYLCYIHDDGWFLRLFYSSWDEVAGLIGGLYPQLDLDELSSGHTAYWVSGNSVEVEEKSLDIDLILNGR